MREKELANEIFKIVERVRADYGSRDIADFTDSKTASAYVGFFAVADYYESISLVVNGGRHLGAGALLRAQLEAWSDLKHIFAKESKVESRSNAYIGAVETFKAAILALDDESFDDKARSLRQVNANWTNSSIEDRVNAAGDSILLTAYDILSYYAHPNPATTVMSLKSFNASLLNDSYFLVTSVRIMIDTLLIVLKWGEDISVKPSDVQIVVAMFIDIIMPDSELAKMVQATEG